MSRFGSTSIKLRGFGASLVLVAAGAFAHGDQHGAMGAIQQQQQQQPQQPQQQHPAGHGSHVGMFNQEQDNAKRVTIRLEDLPLVDQDGRTQRFASDVVGNKLVALSIFYSSCTTVCPVVGAIFAEVQQTLGDRLGQEVELIFLSVDPTTDTPKRLKAYSRKYDARPGWSWLTGEKLVVDKVLNGLGLYTPNYEDHPLTVLVGDENSGRWQRFYGFPGPGEIVGALERLQLARQQAHDQQLAKE